MLDCKSCYLLRSFVVQVDECETVQQSVKVFEDLHSSLSFAQEVLYRPSLAQMPSSESLKRRLCEILPPIALAAPSLNYRLALEPEGTVTHAAKPARVNLHRSTSATMLQTPPQLPEKTTHRRN